MNALPENVDKVLKMLNAAGYEAYVVGGCVRDSILGREINDWDVCTSALPEQMKQVFEGRKTIDTGIKHGTVTVVVDGENIEVTSFRSDGDYSDGRHPDEVRFGVSLEEDLARRDLTCNAIAYSPKSGFVDPFGGMADIENKLLRAVGGPEKRFGEDALRMIRVLRFASVLGFRIEEKTAQAVHDCRMLLSTIAGERLFSELKKLVCGQYAPEIVCEYPDVLGVFIPGFANMAGFEQHSTHHSKDVLGHCADVLRNVDKEPCLCLAALLHDIGKPPCFFFGDDGRGHFFGHEAKGAALLEPIWNRLKPDNFTRRHVTALVRNHHINLSTNQKTLRRTIRRYGSDLLKDEVRLMRADALAHTHKTAQTRVRSIDAFIQAMNAELAATPCLSLDKLAVNGRDMINIGIHNGRKIGETLSYLLDSVIDGKVENERNDLLRFAEEYAKGE